MSIRLYPWPNWFYPNNLEVKVGALCLVQQPGSYWDRFSGLPLVRLEPHRGDNLRLDAKVANHQDTEDLEIT